LEPAGTLLNQALCDRFVVPAVKHTVAPSVFTQGGFVIAADITPRSLGELFAKTMTLTQDDAWKIVAEPEQLAAAAQVDRRYEAITLSVVLLGGLIDGLNPCAFATIIFFLSYLQIARRTPREMLMVGIAFISAVFLAYLAAGLVLYQVLDALNDRFAGIQRWLNLGFGLLALFAAWLSLRDAFRARAGRLDDMTLQLPSILKDRIRKVIRSGARARNFVIAAFVSGLVISLLELACTGQVYAPIIYQIQHGRLDAVLWLVIYNLAFITPLIVIFLLAYGGLRSETLIQFQKRHTFGVKLALALLFLGLALFIFLGPRLL
jgi:cytochrome c biogenesis protein CcdA